MNRPQTLKIASWNVNSIKVRLNQVIDWMNAQHIDILALQETKTPDESFPIEAFQAQGLYVTFSGQKTYNGMAVISRIPIKQTLTDIPGLDDPQRRILFANIAGLNILNLYVPNGSEVGSEKYAYKLDWLAKVSAFIQLEVQKNKPLLVLGDFNIAPEDIDVHDPIEWQGSVLVSAPERAALDTILASGLHDAFRNLNPTSQEFSWWDYRAAGFRRNRGLRIDLILLTKDLLSQCNVCHIDRAPRKHEQPSDHTPVMVELNWTYEQERLI